MPLDRGSGAPSIAPATPSTPTLSPPRGDRRTGRRTAGVGTDWPARRRHPRPGGGGRGTSRPRPERRRRREPHGDVGTQRRAWAATPEATTFDPVAGNVGRHPCADGPGVADLGAAGRWTLTLHPDGALDLAAPPTFTGSRASGHTFSLDGATLRTDLYYNDYCELGRRVRMDAIGRAAHARLDE